jgi:4-amino-4-deoxy-L-arabinose transferase-like glycosyltransferase
LLLANPRLRFVLLAVAAAILYLGAIRLGDLPGYDDAMYSLQAKGIALHGNWFTPKCRDMPTVEHPPLFVWTQAVFFRVFGISDAIAKLPSALAALGCLLLVYWLARRLLGDDLAAALSMFILLATPYFIKYAGHAMTDVPTAFLFLCAICSWILAEDNPPWYLAAGAFAAMSLMVRGLIGLALPVLFAAHLVAVRRRPPWRYVVPALAIALLPIVAWDAQLYWRFRGYFVTFHEGWLDREVFGGLKPAWRRYTGASEYAGMLLKSYWPWLPAVIGGIVIVVRERRRPLYLLLCWIATVFLLCAAARSRVLRYMLPAYPAFAILSSVALLKWAPRRILDRAMDWIPPLSVVAAIGIVLLFPPRWHATEIRDIAAVQSRTLAPGARVGLYDDGEPRYDETNELEWYGKQIPVILLTRADLEDALRSGSPRVIVLDGPTYRERVERLPREVIAQSGHLISVRLR